ncbi:MAG: hypothetical protein NTX25_03270, partial [Proteobacteria bacterium]|nr:hypothetical protein [Pseudomonadota bacterium]
MSEHRPYDRSLSISIDQKKPSKAEIDALELKIVELTGVAEYIAQKIAISQVNSERLEKEVEDFRRVRQQIETDIRAQEELIANKRRETHELEIEIKKHEMTISGQQEQTRTLAETIAIAEKRSRQAIEDFQAETDEKIRAIKHEFESERERINIGFEVHRNQAQAEMKQFNEEMAQTRKKQERAREIEVQEAKKKAEETIEKLLHEGRSKNEALIKATEATALEVHRESEASAKRLLAEA